MQFFIGNIMLIDNTSCCEKKASASEKANLNSLDITKLVPMMQRRRLTTAGKYAVGLTLKSLSANPNISKIIYASRTGETKRCLKLLQNVVRDEPESPAEFSASVHNANVGVASICGSFTGETVAVAAGEKTFNFGLVEAYVSLHAQNNQSVLLVFYEEDIADQNIMQLRAEDNFGGPFACAIELFREDQPNSFKFEIRDSDINIIDTYQK